MSLSTETLVADPQVPSCWREQRLDQRYYLGATNSPSFGIPTMAPLSERGSCCTWAWRTSAQPLPLQLRQRGSAKAFLTLVVRKAMVEAHGNRESERSPDGAPAAPQP
jgi:hypothetical protein